MTGTGLAESLARAVAAKDTTAVMALLHPQIDFRGMTPGRVWEAETPDDVVAAFGVWFADGDDVEAIEALETDGFADRQRVGYRLRVRNADGLHLVEQQAYLSERDGRIGWLRVMCAGYRPVNEDLSVADRPVRMRVPASAAQPASAAPVAS